MNRSNWKQSAGQPRCFVTSMLVAIVAFSRFVFPLKRPLSQSETAIYRSTAVAVGKSLLRGQNEFCTHKSTTCLTNPVSLNWLLKDSLPAWFFRLLPRYDRLRNLFPSSCWYLCLLIPWSWYLCVLGCSVNHGERSTYKSTMHFVFELCKS